MADVHEVDALVRETWGNLLPFLFYVENERQETFDVRCWYIVSVRALDERFSLEVEDGYEAGHITVAKIVAVRGRVLKAATRGASSSPFPVAWRQNIGVAPSGLPMFENRLIRHPTNISTGKHIA